MSRSTTTGLYTRVSNSFSQPVTGTTIDPTDADTFFDDVEESMNSFICTSTTSLTVGTGTKAFTTQTTKAFLVGMFVQAFSQADHGNYMYGTVVSYTGGVLTLDVTVIGGSGTFTDWLLFTAGARGGTGPTGATGREAGLNYKWNASTSTGDPTTGKITISNSGTVLNISETDDDGNALASVIATWDDSTTTGNRGKLYVMKTGGIGLKVFTITSAVTDNGAYDSFTGTVITVGSFSDGDECFCYFIPTGDKGADGAGTGDVVGPAASVDSEVALYSSTTGKLIKRASISGLAKLTSGVLSAAAASTDYIGATTGSEIQKASSGGLTAATPGTDFMKPNTTSALTAGFTSASVSAGTKSSGTYTFDPTVGAVQHATNGGAHTFAPPATMGAWMLDYVNNASAGALTTSGWTKVDGDPFTTTNGNSFRCMLSVGNQGSYLSVKRMV